MEDNFQRLEKSKWCWNRNYQRINSLKQDFLKWSKKKCKRVNLDVELSDVFEKEGKMEQSTCQLVQFKPKVADY